MIWTILALLGVPLWLCAGGLLMVFLQNRGLRKRDGDIPVRIRVLGAKRWTCGHAIWASDVLAWRGSPAAWSEKLIHVKEMTFREPDEQEGKKLKRLGDGFALAGFVDPDGTCVDVAAAAADKVALSGPFACDSPVCGPRSQAG